MSNRQVTGSEKWSVVTAFETLNDPPLPHQNLGKNPFEHTRFVTRKLGEARLEMLLTRQRKIVRYRNHDKAAMRAHYRAELQRILDLRSRGVVGPVEVVSFD